MSSSRSSSTDSSPSSDSSHSDSNHETKVQIKTEDATDEVKIFSASTFIKQEAEDDVDVDGIEDRLSPVVEEPNSPTKVEPSNPNVPNLYPPHFLYPYFHPMWNPYLMAAAAQAQGQNEKPTIDGSANSPFGANLGMSFPGLYPPGMTPPPSAFQGNLFNPFGIPIPTPGLRPPPPSSSSHRSHPSSSGFDRSGKDLNTLLEAKRPRKPHIKKPLNAFMIYMKEQRARVIEECTLKESSAINKVLGQKWKELPRAEQDRYYELAKEERNRHMQLYPGWSARDNYGLKKKRSPMVMTTNPQRKLSRDHPASPYKNPTKNPMQLDSDCLTAKKCRARYGLEGLNQWCKHCRRKKKCTRFLEDDSSHPATGSNSNPNNPSSVSSPAQSDNDESINDFDSDDILSRQIDSIEDENDDSDEENQQQQHSKPPSFFPAQFFPGFSY